MLIMAHSTLSWGGTDFFLFMCKNCGEEGMHAACVHSSSTLKKSLGRLQQCTILLKYGGKVAFATLSSYWPSFGHFRYLYLHVKSGDTVLYGSIPVLYVSIKTVVDPNQFLPHVINFFLLKGNFLQPINKLKNCSGGLNKFFPERSVTFS
jgi:hypothetical protein